MTAHRQQYAFVDPVTPETRAHARHWARVMVAEDAQRRSDAHMRAAEQHRGTPWAAENHAFAEAYAGLADALRRSATTVVA